MKNRIKKYADNLFSDIYDTKQLRELKEEVSANLLEKVNDYMASGCSEDEAFKKAVSSLGDMGELVESLKKASIAKNQQNMLEDLPLDKKHVIGYVVASAILLFGLMTTGIVYLQFKNLMMSIGTLMPFLTISTGLFVYFGLTQETRYEYGMNWKRALAYSLASMVMIFGIFVTGIVYYNGNALFEVVASFMPFLIPSASAFIYLGLTEKCRTKMDHRWQQQWVEYYSNPETWMVRGNISGALWIFAIAAFFVIGMTLGWKFSWLPFIVAVGIETLLNAYFDSKRKTN